jgi:hypothetical protein
MFLNLKITSASCQRYLLKEVSKCTLFAKSSFVSDLMNFAKFLKAFLASMDLANEVNRRQNKSVRFSICISPFQSISSVFPPAYQSFRLRISLSACL